MSTDRQAAPVEPPRVRKTPARDRLTAVFNWPFIRQVGIGRWVVRTAIRQVTKGAGRDLRIKLPTGLTMHLPATSQFASEVYVTGARTDQGAEELLARLLRADEDLLDVGANIGFYSLYMAPRVRTVYAFEPDPRVHASLRTNAAQASNIIVVPLALSNRVGAIGFEMAAQPELSHATDTAANLVEATTIDVFIAEHPTVRVGAIKTDAEGHDLAVLQGSSDVVERFAPLILTEAARTTELFEFCRSHSYSVSAFAYPSGKPRLAALTPITPGLDLETKMLFLVPPRLRQAFP